MRKSKVYLVNWDINASKDLIRFHADVTHDGYNLTEITPVQKVIDSMAKQGWTLKHMTAPYADSVLLEFEADV